ncbi:MAG: hypothetical protein F6K22_23050 [Okeania sp. SIO2F4]|uniref:hypothetical protein n=1 Tax=Okeania sp. SIO2F4 TaxID=2607790 RepID=UPI001429FF82|nr:hypothetical protein [Okeania sp. SIO2F4]NES05438.1 hypothetical protein [Okeania sp. SIO2F4]
MGISRKEVLMVSSKDIKIPDCFATRHVCGAFGRKRSPKFSYGSQFDRDNLWTGECRHFQVEAGIEVDNQSDNL